MTKQENRIAGWEGNRTQERIHPTGVVKFRGFVASIGIGKSRA